MFLIAPDSFKESLTAAEAADAMRRGLLSAIPDAETVCLPLSDGGEGFVATLIAKQHGQVIHLSVIGPLGVPVDATWGLMTGGETAVIEMAQAAGLELVPPDERDPERMTTSGVGELIRSALSRAAKRIVVGIGGSATNDGGLGLAQALGFVLLDEGGQKIAQPATGADLGRVARIVAPPEPDRIRPGAVRVACDVDNPLLGPSGAARTYAAQKGATPEQIKRLETGMARLAEVMHRDLGVDIRDMPGAGAAGGLGAGLVAFAGARLEPGARLVLDLLGFDRHLSGAALVLTGEGAVNPQTLRGKMPWEVHRRAQAHGVPTLLLAGDISRAPAELTGSPLLHIRAIAPAGIDRPESMRRASEFLERATREFIETHQY